RPGPLRGGPGLHRGGWGQPDGDPRGRRSVRGGAGAVHAGGHHPRIRPGRRPGEPGGGRDGEIRRGVPQEGDMTETAAPGTTEAVRTEPEGRAAQTDGFATIEEAVEEIRSGGMIIVVDDADRENEGDFIMAA